MKNTATTAKIRAAVEKQNARRTSRVILLLESRADSNNPFVLVIHTIIHLIECAEWNKVASAHVCMGRG